MFLSDFNLDGIEKMWFIYTFSVNAFGGDNLEELQLKSRKAGSKKGEEHEVADRTLYVGLVGRLFENW